MQRPPRKPELGSATLIATTATATAALAVPAVRRLMLRSGVVDNPSDRSSHSEPVPRGGGWACIAGLAVGLMTARATGQPVPWITALGALSLGLVGAADDRWNIHAAPRLAAQLAAGAVCDVVTHAPLAGVFAVPTLVNVVNFMDGINGITALTTGVWGLNTVAVGGAAGHSNTTILGAALGGAAVGFLPRNAKGEIFLGDVGSYLVGALMAMTALQKGLPLRARIALMGPLVPYLVDTGITLAKRLLNGENVLEAHRGHFYQRLTNEQGHGHLPVALLYAVLAATCAIVTNAVFLNAWAQPHRRAS